MFLIQNVYTIMEQYLLSISDNHARTQFFC